MTTIDLKATFTEAAKGIATNHIVAVLNRMTPGSSWNGCSKSHLAEAYERDNRVGPRMGKDGLAGIDLKQMRQAALERQQAAEVASAKRKAQQLQASKERQDALQARERKLQQQDDDMAIVRAAMQRGDGIEGNRVLKLTITEYAALSRIIRP